MLQVIMDEIAKHMYCFLLLTNAVLLSLVIMVIMQQSNPDVTGMTWKFRKRACSMAEKWFQI
jgi:hypothetical protein